MEHSHAVEHHLVEQYLLDELSPETRDEFEEHFFDCHDCAAELRATSAFLEAAQGEFAKTDASTASKLPPPLQFPASKPRPSIDPRFVLALSALAASLLVMIYQNVVTLPNLRSEVARLDAPEVLPSVSLVEGNSRSGNLPLAINNGGHSLLLQVDIPAEERFASYKCSLYSAQHQLVWTVPVSPSEARDTVSIRVPLTRMTDGMYSLEVRGIQGADAASVASPGVELASYRFNVSGGKLATTR